MSGGINSNVEIEPGALRGLAEDIKKEELRLNDIIAQIQHQMNSLQGDGLEDKGGREARERFAKFRNDYDNKYPQTFNAYRAFLLNTADEYEALENQLRQRAENLSETI